MKKALAFSLAGLFGIGTLFGQPGQNSQKHTAKQTIQPVNTASEKNEYKNELYLTANYTLLNPQEYNEEIKKVSVGEVFGAVPSYGLGYSRKLGGNFQLNLELTHSHQTKNAIKENISTGAQTTFGSNSIGLLNIDPSIKHRFPLLEDIFVEGGIGAALSIADLKSKNDAGQVASRTLIYGPKVSFSIGYELNEIDNLSIRFNAACRFLKKDILDISAPSIGLEAGVMF